MGDPGVIKMTSKMAKGIYWLHILIIVCFCALSLAAVFTVPSLCSQRWNLAALAFFGFFFVYVVRVNLSVAIICMVRTPPHNRSSATANWTTGPDPTALGFPSEIEVTAGETAAKESDGTEKDGEDMCGGDVERDLEASGRVHTGEFNWDKAMQSRLLAMYFYGYIFTQIPGGWLAGRFGGRIVWGSCQLVCAVCTILTPLATRAHIDVASALRFVLGLAAGVSFPCFHAMMGRWAPKLERSKLVAFAFAGPPIGTILSFSLSALLCSYGFDNGWGSIFYLSGAGLLLWVVIWLWCVRDTPVKDARITAAERDYILTSIGERPDAKEKIATPWRAILTSGPLWAIIMAHLCNNYTNYTLLTSLPTFMKEVLHFDIKQNGALSAVPYLCMAVSAVLVGQLADFLRTRQMFSTKNTRKIFQCTSFLGQAACLCGVGYMTCGQRSLAVFLLSLVLCFAGFNRAGYAVNHIDLAPRHAGVLFGITNTASTIPGIIAPIIAGALTPNRTAEEWQKVFFVCAGVCLLGALIFVTLADGEVQSWATPPDEVIEVDVTSNTTGEKEDRDGKISGYVQTQEEGKKADLD